MGISKAEIDHLKKLAKLEFSTEEESRLTGDLEKMVSFINKLSEVNTDGIEPLTYVNTENPEYRKDEPKQEITKAEALKNAPKSDGDYIRVPKVK